MQRVLIVFGLAIGASGMRAAEAWKLPLDEPQFRKGPGAEIAVGNCVICHSADYVSMQPPLDSGGWTAIVQKMREKYGAPLPAQQVDTVVNYLVTAYGKK